MLPASSPAHSRVTLSGFPFETPGTWARKTGDAVSVEPRRHREGGELFKEEVSGGPSTTETITVSRNFRRDRDLSLYKAARRFAGRVYGSISQQPLGEDGEPWGDPIVSEVLLLGVGGLDVDADDTSGFQSLEFTLAVSGESA